MDKKYLHGYTVIAFVFIIYGAAIIPFPKTVIFGIAFAFSLLAITAQLYTVYTVMKSQTLIKDRLYDFPQIRVSVLYLTVQLLTSLLLMGFSVKIPVFVAVFVEVIILAIAALGFFAVGAVRKEAVRQEAQLKNELARMEELQTRINLLIAQCGEEQIKDILQKLSEEIRYSNPISRDSSKEIEDEIDVLFSEAEMSALDGDMENTAEVCERLRGLLKERDRICKYSK